MGSWKNAFVELKADPDNFDKQETLISMVKKAAKGKTKEYKDIEVVIPQAKALVEKLEKTETILEKTISKTKDQTQKQVDKIEELKATLSSKIKEGDIPEIKKAEKALEDAENKLLETMWDSIVENVNKISNVEKSRKDIFDAVPK